ncbi:hypothetical protein GDO81_014652 [Engystomops pustulosus]|uniref:VWFD domain-containing protein n=1 Tax=Engystomops pustulosus TaxID=76066 RepID=A0AAV7BBR2_ENGPU|nr:hypothetical protein GDO81_014652 [Engystomops pustulosus]
MQNYQVSYSKADFQLFITGYNPSTTVTIWMNKSSFKQVLTVNERSTLTVQIPGNAELGGSTKSCNVIGIKSDKPVSVLSLNFKFQSADTSIVYPIEQLGTDYYIVTPLGGPDDGFKEFSVVSYEEPTNVDIFLTGAVTYQEKTYAAGSKLTVLLEPYNALQLLSKDNLSGTRVVSQKPVAVLSGHTCTWKNSKCNHVYEQLRPVNSWGTSFIIPPISLQFKSDIIFVVAAVNTKIDYQIETKATSKNLNAGEVIQLDVPVKTPIFLTASSGIQVIYYCTGWQDKFFSPYDPILMTIPPVSSYCSSYYIYGQKEFENYGTLVAKKADISKVTYNKGPITDLSWNDIPGTDYSWATQRLGKGFSFQLVENPSSPFMLLSYGFVKLNSYGSPATCVEGPSCSTVKCRAKEKCQMSNGKPICVPDSEAYCHAVGDPHFRTFDGYYYDFQGTCTYTIAKTCGSDSSLPTFNIEAKNENRGNTRVAYVSYVTIQVYDYSISLVRYEYGFVRVNNQRLRLPMSLNDGQVRLYQSGGSVVIETDFTLKVYYDWNSFLKVFISSSFFQSVCGLCGNYNGNPSDDLMTPTGTLAPNLVDFGKSWKVDDGDRFCWHNCNGECKTCPLETQQTYKSEQSCGLISKLLDGPFRQCHSVIDPKTYVDNCVYDLCMNGGSKQILCQSLKSYADACQRSKVSIGEWRQLSRCPMSCPVNSEYKLCAQACPATCNDDATPSVCSDSCVESCQCKAGYVLDEGKCIPKASCGCIYQGKLYAPNEKFWGDNKCEKQCICNPSTKRVECKATKCKSSEQCAVVNGIQNCYPVSYGTCSASGDPHYITFDGMRYDFQGTCIYQFAGVCKKSEDLVDFQVNVQNENRGSKVVSYVSAVQVKVYEFDIVIDRKYKNRILLNGVLTNLPYVIDVGRLSIYKQGFHAIIQTSFGLRVSYNWESHVAVTLPSSYAGAVCGLCGNFDNDKSNEFLMKNNQLTTKPTLFGNSWKVQNVPGCYEEDKGDCLKLAELELRHNNNKEGCGIIKDKNGPFRECHAKINPDGHFKSCVYDACFYEGREDVLCKIIASYATLCQDAGVTIYPWRTSKFCSKNCPKNSHIEDMLPLAVPHLPPFSAIGMQTCMFRGCEIIHSYAAACQAAGVTIQPWRTDSFCPLKCPANSQYKGVPMSALQHALASPILPKCPETCSEGYKNGPFRECHAKINPDGHFKSCVYDACFYEGREDVLCKIIASYATLCQDAGVTIYPWRTSKFCSKNCPKNSHYEVCASGCAPTCLSLSPPLGCKPVCSEGCECNDGFILSGGDCVPISQCGCQYNDRYYKAGEVFFPSGLCNQQCVCTTSGAVECKAFSCGPNEECKVIDGVQKCQPVGSAQCSAAGDPHYMSFDGLAFDFQGTCTYTLTKTITNRENLVPFAINVKNEKWGNGKVAVTKLVSFEVYGYNLILEFEVRGKILVNGEYRNLPVNLEDGKIRVYQHGIRVLIDTDFGVQVNYDLVYHVLVTVPGNYKNLLGGLCGNYNGDRKDDLQLPDKTVTTDATKFGASWKVQIPGVTCDDGCGGSGNLCPACDAKKQEIFKTENYCGFMKKSSGPLSACYAKINPDTYFNNCIYDLCANEGDGNILCHSIHSYAAACQAAGVTIQPWRTDSFCPLKCPANSQYKACADVCSSTCAGVTDPAKCPETCSEGCECNDGFFFDGKDCVSMDQCGCFEDGRYYQPNEKVLSSDCKQACTCSPMGGLICEDTGCAADEICKIKDGIVACINKDPCKTLQCRIKETCKIQNGNAVCVPDFTGTCWAWGDPHYHTFDGYNYDFQGTCTYVLAKYGGGDPGLVPFTIEEKNDNRGSQAVSFVRTVTISLYGYKIAIMKGEFGKVRVNDVITNLPVTLLDGKISASISGLNAVIRTDFGLQVTYEYNWHVVVTLSSSYYGLTKGLCGNFNQNFKDELITADNKAVTSIVDWAKSWKVNDRDPFCFDYCPGLNCPTCNDAKKSLYGDDKRCGLISKVGDGPFRECHSKVNPDNFFDSCLYDVCINNGANQFLCPALNAYADTCRKQGVKIYDWRTPSGCVLACPANSHYEFCGKACPATCTDRTAPSRCTEACVETCQCNDGFVLSGDKCVPVGQCGCSYNGAYYQANQEFWEDDNCRRLCKCDPTLGMVVCKESSCKSTERCMVNNGVRSCQPFSFSTCSGWGDPHYTTFDGKRFDFMGTCVYQLVGVTSTNPSIPKFKVTVQNNNRGGNKAVSYTKVVTLEVYDITVTLSMDFPRRILVDGVVTSLPFYYQTNKVVAYISGSHGIIKTDFEITVKYDWNSYVEVTIPSTFANVVGGLCGNFNKNPNDDFNMKNGNPAPNAVQFGNSWKVADVPGCTPECSGSCPLCSEAQKQEYKTEKYCGLINKPSGPFSQCHAVVDPIPFFNDCIFDACQYKGHPSSFCNAIGLYVAACQAAGVKLQEWRSPSFCSLSCPPNTHYELCGNACPVTCHGLSSPTGCDSPCKEACYCDNGYLLSGHKCVPIASCGCVYQDKYYQKNEIFYPKGQCSERCQCGSDGIVRCKSEACGPEEECKLVNGAWGCQPKDCGRCVASGDPHYISFDGLRFDFQGTCTYILSKVVADDSQLPKFTIVVENESYGNGRVAVTRLVVVSVYGYTIAIERNMRSKVKVDGELNNLPLVLDDDNVMVNQEGNNVVLQTDFGLKILYDTVYHVLLSIPSTYRGKLGGLCGNFNGDRNDEFQLPNKQVVKNVNDFGLSWKVNIAGAKCSDGCKEGECPVCADAKLQPFKATSSCGMITNPSGPFKACHSKINPDEYFTHCIYDSCAVDGKDEILCKSLQAYAAACHAIGVTISAWRTPTFCPLSCPANSHYELCTRTCEQTCSGLTAPMKCTNRCFEGCECNAGYVLDRDTCVTADKCGCAFNGKYLSEGESFITADCTRQCKCQAGANADPSCSTVKCRNKERCEMSNEKPRCLPDSVAYCHVTGDPHYRTFDGYYYDFQGTCTYTIAKTCGSDSSLPAFNIETKNENRGNTQVSYVGYVTVQVYNYSISIVRNEYGFVRVNNQHLRLPMNLNEGRVYLYQSGDSVVIETDFALKVYYDWNFVLKVSISSSFFQRVCGLCGNYNGNSSDDLMTPTGTLAPNLVEFGRSWKVDDGDRVCWHNCNGECKPCPLEIQRTYASEKSCGLISKVVDGPFSQCHSVIDPKPYLDNCVYDLCMNDGSKQILCQSLKTYADACQRNKSSIGDWRQLSGCSMSCPENSEYKLCAQACPATCNDDAKPSICSESCVESCQCKAGYVLDEGKCIPKASCGCIYQGKLYAPNEKFWDDRKCEKQCICNPSTKKVECKATKCKSSEQCAKCQPVGSAQCSASGDPHYMSFDGLAYDFQGTCTYTLTKTITKGENLIPFLINNYNRGGNAAVSYTKVVNLEVYNMVLSLSLDFPRHILVDGVVTSLPFYYQTNKVVAFISGGQGIIKTDFEVTVTFEWNNYMAVRIPSTYENAIGGLCGNFNKNPEDDFKMINGTSALNPVQFGNSWKVGDIPGCSPEYTGNCVVQCSEAQKLEYKTDKYCGLITNPNGPFSQCYPAVDPTPFFNDCIFDVCQYKSHPSSFCNAISLYVAACQVAGIKLQEWRSQSFCSLSCPPNTHYELCGNACPVTCHGLSPPTGCDSPCKEACYCDNGYVLSGHKCVPIASCGCVYQDKYYQKNEIFYPKGQCSEKCQCDADGIVRCKSEACGPEEECKLANGAWGCQPKEYKRCVVSGDAHYISFDGLGYDFQGTCTYILSKVVADDAPLVRFSIAVENESYGKFSMTRIVLVSLYNYTVALERGMRSKVKVNGELNSLPLVLDNGNILVNQEGSNVILQTDFGLKVLDDAVYHVILVVPSTYHGKLGGLCGNYNGDRNDDFQLPNKEVVKNVNDFGLTWKVNIARTKCSDGCKEGECPVCADAKLKPFKATSSCGMITNPSGPFKACHSKINPDDYFNHCIYDSCAVDGKDEILCKILQAYTAACQAVGVMIDSWRTSTFCYLPCPANSHYELCTRTCEQTCSGLSAPMKCTDQCFEGCECNMGYVLDGDKCVTADKCGCVIDGRYLSEGESFITADCTRRCSCQAGGVTCTEVQCVKEECGLRKGVRGCYKVEGECFMNELTFVSFDGLVGEPLGNGFHELVSLCDEKATEWFRVVADIQSCGKTTAPVSRLHIFLGCSMVTISKDKEVWVNGRLNSFPVDSGILSANAGDGSVLIQIGSNLRIELMDNGDLLLYISEELSGLTCGACGNFNKDITDDPNYPGGKSTTAVSPLLTS